MNNIDPLDRLLDQAQPPPPPADFAARIAARATGHPQDPSVRPARDRRGGWARRHRTFATFIAANLLVASAVAAAIVSGADMTPLRKVPLIAPVIEAIAPRPKPKKIAVPVHHPAALRSPAPTVPEADATPVPAPPIQPMQARRAIIVARVHAREAAGLPVPPRLRAAVELQDLKREAMARRQAGEPVPPALRRRMVRDRLAVMPAPVRRRVIEEMREHRAAGEPVPPLREMVGEARASLGAAPAPVPDAPAPQFAEPAPSQPDAAAPETRRERMRQRLDRMPPAMRQQLIERMRARRMMRRQRGD